MALFVNSNQLSRVVLYNFKLLIIELEGEIVKHVSQTGPSRDHVTMCLEAMC